MSPSQAINNVSSIVVVLGVQSCHRDSTMATPLDESSTPARQSGVQSWILRIVGISLVALLLGATVNIVAKVIIVVSFGYTALLPTVIVSWRTAFLAACALLLRLVWARRPGLPSVSELRHHRRAWGLGLFFWAAIVLVPSISEQQPNDFGFRVDDPSETFWVDRNHPHRPPALVTTNDQGFRDTQWSTAPARGARRIAVVGDSYVYGKGVPDEAGLIDRLLEARLNQLDDNAPWEVLNLGYPGHGFLSNLDLARLAIEQLGPRAVVIGCLGMADWDIFEVQEQYRAFGPIGFGALTAMGVTEDLWNASLMHSMGLPQRRDGVEAFIGFLLIEQRMRSLLDAAETRHVDVVIWEYYEPFSFYQRFKDHPNLHVTGWPSGFERSWNGWGSDPRLAIPVDRHPTAAANSIIAEHLAPQLVSLVNSSEQRIDIGLDRR